MAFKFRRTLKIAPGLRLNLTHRGVSARVGTKGAGYTVNANGQQHISAGLPGSGVHISKQVKPPRKRKRKSVGGNRVVSATPSLGHMLRTGAMIAFAGLAVIIILGILR